LIKSWMCRFYINPVFSVGFGFGFTIPVSKIEIKKTGFETDFFRFQSRKIFIE